MRILYGDSMTKDNVGELIVMKDIDGTLVSGKILFLNIFMAGAISYSLPFSPQC